MSKPYNIYYDPELKSITMNWDGYATSAQFREGTEYMLKLLKENNAVKVLANIRDMTLISSDDQNWVQYNFIPRAVEAGFRAIAIVRPTAYFNAVAVETISYRIKQTVVQMRIFDDLQTARDWVGSLNEADK